MSLIFEVTDDHVRHGLSFRRTKRKRYVTPIGDSGLVRISEPLAHSVHPDWLLLRGHAIVTDDNQVLLNSYDDPATRDHALVLLRITAVPARKRVTYELPAEQVLMSAPVVRSFGQRTHRWHETLIRMQPNQLVLAHIESVFPAIHIEPLEIHFNGATITCGQRSCATSPADRKGDCHE